MRDLNECTAAVFRRGEKRIKERRRNRNRALAVCIPIFLIAAVWSVMSLPAMTPLAEAYRPNQATGEAAGNAPESLACPYIAVEIQDGGMFPAEHDGKVTDPAAIAEMFGVIDSLFAEVDGNGQKAGENLPAMEDNEHHDLVESPGESRSYTITFTTEDGSQAVYRLSGNMLVNGNTNKTVFLSDAQAAGLTAVLGLSE